MRSARESQSAGGEVELCEPALLQARPARPWCARGVNGVLPKFARHVPTVLPKDERLPWQPRSGPRGLVGPGAAHSNLQRSSSTSAARKARMSRSRVAPDIPTASAPAAGAAGRWRPRPGGATPPAGARTRETRTSRLHPCDHQSQQESHQRQGTKTDDPSFLFRGQAVPVRARGIRRWLLPSDVARVKRNSLF